jgi:hypothetical protein
MTIFSEAGPCIIIEAVRNLTCHSFPPQQLRMIESVLGPVLGYAEEILTKRLFVRDTERETTYTTYLAYATGRCQVKRFIFIRQEKNGNGYRGFRFISIMYLAVMVVAQRWRPVWRDL